MALVVTHKFWAPRGCKNVLIEIVVRCVRISIIFAEFLDWEVRQRYFRLKCSYSLKFEQASCFQPFTVNYLFSN